ncbi:hypothetical protein ACHMW6_13410 [Pseudoduganella sp. UC29_106]|uniref:hypothetical protein n=1 Tax=Pseudoduganella sp. UC29_106 TaxID=3374553 RepID=UPI0037575EBE
MKNGIQTPPTSGWRLKASSPLIFQRVLLYLENLEGAVHQVIDDEAVLFVHAQAGGQEELVVVFFQVVAIARLAVAPEAIAVAVKHAQAVVELVADEDAVLVVDRHIAGREGFQILAVLLPAEVLHELHHATGLQLPLGDAVVQRIGDEDFTVAVHFQALRRLQRAVPALPFAAEGHAVVEQVAFRAVLVHAHRTGVEVGDEDQRRPGANLA